MLVKPIPDGFSTITPYLTVNNAEKLIDFLKLAFDAQLINCTKIDGMILNAEVKIGNSMLMIADARNGSNLSPVMLYLYVEDTDALYKKAIAAGAESLMEPMDQFYGDRSAAVKDFCNNQWWIATRQENVSSEELEKRLRNQ